MMEMVVTTGLLELQVVQSSSQIITTNKPTCHASHQPSDASTPETTNYS